MSTILDALKRSEQERKINKTPTLSDMPAPEERSRWPLIVLSLLLILLLSGLVWFLLGGKLPAKQVQEIIISNETVGNFSRNQEAGDSESIKVSIISYAQEPSARFVIVNDKLFREGEFVKAGVKIETILPDSVVLLNRGKRITYQP